MFQAWYSILVQKANLRDREVIQFNLGNVTY